MTVKAARPEPGGVTAGRGIHLIPRGAELAKVSQFGVMHPQFLPADMDSVLLGSFTDFPGGYLYSVRQDIPEPLSLNHFFRHGYHSLMVPPLELDAAGVFPGDNAFLI